MRSKFQGSQCEGTKDCATWEESDQKSERPHLLQVVAFASQPVWWRPVNFLHFVLWRHRNVSEKSQLEPLNGLSSNIVPRQKWPRWEHSENLPGKKNTDVVIQPNSLCGKASAGAKNEVALFWQSFFLLLLLQFCAWTNATFRSLFLSLQEICEDPSAAVREPECGPECFKWGSRIGQRARGWTPFWSVSLQTSWISQTWHFREVVDDEAEVVFPLTPSKLHTRTCNTLLKVPLLVGTKWVRCVQWCQILQNL